MLAEPSKAVEVFYSYAHKDDDLRDQLEEHLASLRRQGYIKEWHDRRIGAGTEWEQEIDTHLNTASIILLLISSSFLASDYCYSIEMQRALERHKAHEARVIPIILRPVDWQGTPFEKIQVLPANAKPITTWTNQDEAFLDVTRGIRKAIEGWTTPAVSTSFASKQYWNVPYQRNHYFTGQEEILTYLRHQFSLNLPATPMHIQAISGLGGIGKTQLALEYAYRHRDEYQAIFWANADTRESLTSDYISLTALLELPEYEAQDQSIAVEAIKRWLDKHDQWLLILDNADDVTMIYDFLPQAGKGHVLLTTRAYAQGTIAQGIVVEPMGEPEGTLFLLRRAKVLVLNALLDQAATADYNAAKAIVQTLGGLPLALDQAGAYIEETGCGLSGYLKRYQTHRNALLRRRGKLVTEHPEPVTTTWSLSFKKVEQTSPAAADLMRFCAFLHQDAIPEELITESASGLSPTLRPLAANLIALDEAMEALRTYSLMRRNPNTNTLSMHHLVQAVLRDTMNEKQQRKWTKRTVQAINQVFPTQENTPWPRSQRYIVHAQVCASLIERWGIATIAAAELLYAAGNYLYERAEYAEAEPLLQRASTVYDRVLGPNHPGTATSLNRLATLYKTQGKYTEAETLHQHALTIYEQALGPDHPYTATGLNNLATLYWNQGKYAEAEPLLQRTFTIYEQALGSDHPDTAQSLNNLAMLYKVQGKYAEAEPLLQRALSIWEQALGPNHPNMAQSLNNLALLYWNQGKYAEAEPLLQRALSIWEQALGPDHPNTAYSLNNLAALYQDQGKYAEAESLYLRALTIWEQMLGSDHPNTMTTLNNLALLYQDQGKYAEAEAFLQRALTGREQTLGSAHSDTAASLNNLAALYQDQGKYAEAEALLQHALTVWEQVLGPNHPYTVTCVNNLATLYWNQGKPIEAQSLAQRFGIDD